MFETPIDAWYVWVGLAAVATATAGVAVGTPTAPPPDADAVAETIESVAGRNSPASATHVVVADAVRIDGDSVSLRNEAGVAHASFAFGPVVTVTDEPLVAVARGEPPETVFESSEAFAEAVRNARQAEPRWQRGEEPRGEGSRSGEARDGVGLRLHVSHVTWGGEDVTLVAVV